MLRASHRPTQGVFISNSKFKIRPPFTVELFVGHGRGGQMLSEKSWFPGSGVFAPVVTLCASWVASTVVSSTLLYSVSTVPVSILLRAAASRTPLVFCKLRFSFVLYCFSLSQISVGPVVCPRVIYLVLVQPLTLSSRVMDNFRTPIASRGPGFREVAGSGRAVIFS